MSGKRKSWQVQKTTDGSWVDLTYESTYINGAATEYFRLARSDGEMRILIHNYNSPVFLR